MTIIYISLHLFNFCGHTAHLFGLQLTKNPKILSKTVAEGPENMIRVKVINLKWGTDAPNDDNIHLFSSV